MRKGEGHFSGLLVESTAVVQNPLAVSASAGKMNGAELQRCQCPREVRCPPEVSRCGGQVCYCRSVNREGRPTREKTVMDSASRALSYVKHTPFCSAPSFLRYAVEIWNKEVTEPPPW